MNRIIKFRAWLLKEKKMVTVDTLCNNKGYGGALEIIVDNPSFNPNKKHWTNENRPCDSYLNHSMDIHKERSVGDDFVLMQFTGLTDKNGKEIYEWDIVMVHYDEEDYYGILSADLIRGISIKGIGRVHFRGKESQQLGKPNGKDWWIKGRTEIEIIGNIYQTPQLLNP